VAPHPASSRTMEMAVYRIRTCSNIGKVAPAHAGHISKAQRVVHPHASHDDVQRAVHRSHVNYTIGRFLRYGQIKCSTRWRESRTGTSKHTLRMLRCGWQSPAPPCSPPGLPDNEHAASMTSVTNTAPADARRSRPIYIKTDYEVGHAYYRRVLVQGRALSNQRHTNCYTRVCWCWLCQYLGAGSASGQYLLSSSAVSCSGELRDFRSVADSGNIMHRRFCPQCGTHVIQ